jgi:hypothetical protein
MRGKNVTVLGIGAEWRIPIAPLRRAGERIELRICQMLYLAWEGGGQNLD